MRALITGGAGFIGSHLAEELLKRGYSVCIFDDLSTGYFENIKHLLASKKFSFVRGSILDRLSMAGLIEQSDIVFHLAAVVGVKYVMNDPLKAFEVNIRGTEIILELVNKRKQKIIIASSSEVYGKNECIPFKEEGDLLISSPSVTRWSYACTKILDEFMALSYHVKNELPVVIVRFFNICGPRQTGAYGMVIPNFVSCALAGEQLIVHGDGSQRRCFTDVYSTIKAIISLSETKDAVGKIFNIGSTDEIEIRELANKIIKMTNSNSEIKYVSYKEVYGEGFEDIKRRVPDISKISNLINWKPQMCLDKLLEKVIIGIRSRP